jgi:hypothetical protein
VTILTGQREACKCSLRKGIEKEKYELKQLEDNLHHENHSFRQALYKLPNPIDDGVETSLKETDTWEAIWQNAPPPTITKLPSSSLEDPFYCIGGYDEILVGSNNYMCALRRPGIVLAKALQDWFVEAIEKSFQTEHRWSISNSYCLSSKHYKNDDIHEAVGCSSETCRVCKFQVCEMPEWMPILQSLSGSYWDRQLPVIHLLECSNTVYDNDNRERTRRASWISNKKRAKPWYHRLMVSHTWQILAVTGPSLEDDSRPLQIRIVETLVGLLRQLVPPGVCIRVRVASPAELELFESSRIVIESSLPYSSQYPVILGYVSNFQDYCTNRILRHGATKEGLHVIQGTILSIGETLEWSCQHGLKNQCVQIPLSLAQKSLPNMLEYKRRVIIKKNYKKAVKNIAPSQPRESKEQLPSPDRIRAEALSSPYHFLPFYL